MSIRALLLVLLALPAAAFAGEPGLTAGVSRIAAPGVPGPLSVVGDKAFPLVCATGDGFLQPVVAAARHDRGRVVVFGHTGYLDAAALRRHDTGRLLENAVRWAGGDTVGVLELEGAAKALEARKIRVVRLALRDLPKRLTKLDVLCLRPSKVKDEALLDAVRDFVAKGGGLVAADLGWGWRQLNPGRDLASEHPGNRLLAPMGIVFTGGYLEAPGAKGYPVAEPSRLAHAGRALDSLLARSGDAAYATRIVVRAAASLPLQDPFLLPRLRELPEQRADLERVRLAVTIALAKRLPAEEIRAHPAAAEFPGAVPGKAPRVTREVVVDPAVPGWTSTGLYAPPGEVVTVRGGAGLRVRIGAHSDQLYGKQEWRRAPEVSFVRALGEPGTRVASPFGGLVYIEVPGKGKDGEATLTVSGAVLSPLFVLGETAVSEWRSSIRRRPGPWAELATRKVILTVPSRVIRNLDDPRPVLRFWDEVLDACADLAGRPMERRRPERYVADVQISAGYMHSGYPIMTHLDVAPVVVDLEQMRAGRWGLFHEMGHNHQSRDWTFAGTGEVTVNLFTLYVFDRVCGKKAKTHGALSPAKRKKAIAAYFEGGADFEVWKRQPFTALIVYVQVIEEFGWEPFRRVFREYRDLPAGERPKSDAEKRDQWLVRLSRAVGRDLGPLFTTWGIPTSEGARASVSDLPEWMPAELSAK
jgi:hypothetical protein